jgi:hypothetical protein
MGILCGLSADDHPHRRGLANGPLARHDPARSTGAHSRLTVAGITHDSGQRENSRDAYRCNPKHSTPPDATPDVMKYSAFWLA